MSYLIKNDQIIATTSETLKSGSLVDVAYKACKENIDASREVNLVNAFTCKVSNAKKWEKEAWCADHATPINGGLDEFLL